VVPRRLTEPRAEARSTAVKSAAGYIKARNVRCVLDPCRIRRIAHCPVATCSIPGVWIAGSAHAQQTPPAQCAVSLLTFRPIGAV
jgi:hypothetical protein